MFFLGSSIIFRFSGTFRKKLPYQLSRFEIFGIFARIEITQCLPLSPWQLLLLPSSPPIVPHSYCFHHTTNITILVSSLPPLITSLPRKVGIVPHFDVICALGTKSDECCDLRTCHRPLNYYLPFVLLDSTNVKNFVLL